jgi:hypothetical protein
MTTILSENCTGTVQIKIYLILLPNAWAKELRFRLREENSVIPALAQAKKFNITR